MDGDFRVLARDFHASTVVGLAVYNTWYWLFSVMEQSARVSSLRRSMVEPEAEAEAEAGPFVDSKLDMQWQRRLWSS